MAIQPVTNAALPSGLAPSLPQPPAPSVLSPAAQSAEGTPRVGATHQADAVAGMERTKTTQPPPSRDELEEAVKKVQKAVEPVAQNLLFSIDEDTGKTVIKVIDSSTKETIRQIPSEEILSIAKALDKLQGLLIRQEA